MPHVHEMPASPVGDIPLVGGYTFHYMLGGNTVAELYGYTRGPDGKTVKGSSGWYRTTDPQAAARTAHWNLYGDNLVESGPT